MTRFLKYLNFLLANNIIFILCFFVSEKPVKSLVDDSKTLFGIGEIVAVKSQQHDTWHRARIIEVFECDDHDLDYIGETLALKKYD